MKIGDVVTIVAVLMISVILLVIPMISRSNYADFVMIDGEYYKLQEDNVILLEKNGYHLTVVIENGFVYVSQTDCPDSICRMMGDINKSGQFIACVPAGIYIEIGGRRLNVDSVAG